MNDFVKELQVMISRPLKKWNGSHRNMPIIEKPKHREVPVLVFQGADDEPWDGVVSEFPFERELRVLIEGFAVAFIVAFLFRTFEVEAFVIPTGSEAPMLYGQHRDVYCTQCGTPFAVGVRTVGAVDIELRDGWIMHNDRSHFAICPNGNCRFPNDILDHEMFAGDRILVNKFSYEFSDPERWDRVVFKFPEQAKTNYIKRLAGLPGEELRIENGDVKVRPIGSSSDVPYRVARKTPEKQRHLQMLVHDNDRPARKLLETSWPESWAAERPSDWATDAKARSFRIDPGAADSERLHCLRYTHYLPRADDWTRALAGKPPAVAPQPQLIKDFYAYNSRITVLDARDKTDRGLLPDLNLRADPEQWVGDLTLTCQVEVLAASGELTFELVEGNRLNRCTIDLATGRGQFEYVDEPHREGENPRLAGEPFETGMNQRGRYAVSFANVDDRLCLWVENRLVKSLDFEPGSQVEPQKAPALPTDRDKAPVRITSRMAKLRIGHLRIERDVFYLSSLSGGESGDARVYRLKDDPDDRNDEFLMLGDNSPQSNDSRTWHTTYSVPRQLLIGKAFFRYWPNSVPFMNGGRGYPIGSYYEPPARDRDPSSSYRAKPGPPLPKYSVPVFPQFGRINRIR